MLFSIPSLRGHLSFAKHLTRTMQGDLHLVGITTNDSNPIYQWYTKTIEGSNCTFLMFIEQ